MKSPLASRADDDRADRSRFATSASRALVATVVALALLGTPIASAGGTASADSTAPTLDAQTQDASPAGDSFVVSLEDDGDATAAIVVQFDLTDAADREAFEALETNETKQANLETRTERRFRAIADEASAEADREMTIEDASVSFETVDGGDRGVVTVSVTWTGFAATDGDRLTVAEPLASGFAADQPVVLELPDGYALERATPTPSTETADRVSWNADASLEGFEAVIAPESGAGTAGGDSVPAPGAVAVSLAVGAGVWLHRRR